MCAEPLSPTDTQRHFDIMELERCLCGLISANPGALQNEAKLQELIAVGLKSLGILFEKEKRFGSAERVDFWLPGPGLAVEIKRRSAGLAALSQVGRYLGHAEVMGAIMIATRFSETIPMMEGKPVRFIALWKFCV